MALLTQIINVHYQGNCLSLLASDNRTPLYTVKTTKNEAQLTMIRHGKGAETKVYGTANFKYFSTDVPMTIGEHSTVMQRSLFLSRTSHFTSCSGETLFWKPDGMWTGDFKLVNKKEEVLALFRNKVLNTAEVGSFEIIAENDEEFVDEVVISGLSMLVMVQSSGLAMMVLFGGDS